MEDAEITAYLVKHLSHVDDPNDLILDLCQKTGRPWSEIEALLQRVQEEHRDEITNRQSPFLIILAFGTFIGGIILIAFGIYPIVTALVTLSQDGLDNLMHSQEFYFIVNTMAHFGVSPLIAIFVGIAMVLGSLLGMREVWVAIIGKNRFHQ